MHFTLGAMRATVRADAARAGARERRTDGRGVTRRAGIRAGDRVARADASARSRVVAVRAIGRARGRAIDRARAGGAARETRARSTHESDKESAFFVDTPKTTRERAIELCDRATGAFPVFVALGAAVGMMAPGSVSWFRGDAVTHALALTMLGMGITLNVNDFTKVFEQPWKIGMGVALQYTVMPTLAFLVAKALLNNASLAAGLVLVGCCPGGTASNVVAYIAGASVPLSVTLTTVSTFMAAVMTPTLTKHLAGKMISVDVMGLFVSTLKVVLIPVVVGLLLKKFAPKQSEAVEPFAPIVAVLTVALICSSIIGRTSAQILAAGPSLLAAVVALHSLGFLAGYVLSRGAGFSVKTSRTMSIEVGMQNSALGVVLASAHFADPLVAVPCAISATAHSVIGSMLAAFWRYWDDTKAEREAKAKEKWRNDPNYSAYNSSFRAATGLSNI